MKKKIIAFAIAFLMMLSVVPDVFAWDLLGIGKSEDKYVWIKGGTTVYKEKSEDSESDVTSLPYCIKIVSEDGEWYEFSWTDLISGSFLHDYKWVKISNTSVEEPEDDDIQANEPSEPSCSCGYTGEDDNIALHIDGCERKTYVKSLFEGISAEEIYAGWDSYSDELQDDLLKMLETWDSTKYEALKALIGGGTTSDPDEPVVDGEKTEFEGGSLVMDIPEGVFSEGTVASVEVVEATESITSAVESSIGAYLSDYTVKTLHMDVIDISFVNNGAKVQPNGEVYLSFDIDLVDGAENVAVFHIKDDGTAELMAIQDVAGSQDTMSMTIAATSFSHYVALQSATTYNATLMRDELKKDEYGDRYEIVTFPVTLNDFVDAEAFNKKYPSGLLFTTGNSGYGMNAGGLPATLGIVDENLSSKGFPVLTQGTDNLEVIFNSTEIDGVKEAYTPQFEFIYDTVTGYYSYNSGANHAQLTTDGQTVELYADTMAPFNYRTIEQLTDAGTKYTLNVSAKEYSSSEYTHFCVKFNSAVEGTIRIKVTYDSGSYTDGVAVDKGWGDVVFGAFAKDKIVKSVELWMDSIDITTSVTIDSSGFLCTDNDTEINFAGFYPFGGIADITDSTAGSGYVDNKANSTASSAKFNKEEWERRIDDGDNAKLYSSRSMYNREYKKYEHSLSDDYVYFSMAMEVDFYIPEGGKVNDEDIVFNFNGDDDLWVFVDGKLALDIGGAHTDVLGEINFTTGETWIENYRNITDTFTETDKANETQSYKNCIFGRGETSGKLSEDQYAPGTYHKMQVFYMERAGTNSNCLIKFNLPVVPTGDVIVSKEIAEQNNNELVTDTEFEFKIEIDDRSRKAVDTNGITYKVIEGISGSTDGEEHTLGSDGKFKLKAGYSAVFAGIEENSSVTVTEIQPGDIPGVAKYLSSTVAGENGTSTEKPTTKNMISFDFTNTYQIATTLTIEKEVEGIADPEHSYMFEITKPDRTKMTVVLKQQDFEDGKASVTITDLPAGIYTVKELADWAWRDEFVSVAAEIAESDKDDDDTDESITFDLTYQGETLKFTNKYDEIYWLGDDCAVENIWDGQKFTTEDPIYQTTDEQ